MLEIGIAAGLFIVIILASEFAKSYRFSLVLGMFFICFMLIIPRTVPHLRGEHDEKFTITHFIEAALGKYTNLHIKCPDCNSEQIFIEEATTDTEIKGFIIVCGNCGRFKTGETVKEILILWKQKK